MANQKRLISELSYRGLPHSRILQVAMGEGVIAKAPDVILAVGLGSCVVIALYDPKQKIGGLAHIMLPGAARGKEQWSAYQYADTALDALLQGLLDDGAIGHNIIGKMVGGAQMFSYLSGNSPGIGAQNIMALKDLLKKEQIPLIGQDVGGHWGRSIEFQLDSGSVIVNAIGREDRTI